MGWIMVMFDLPVGTKDERHAAAVFRKNLLDDGYMMVNFSVYARPCVSWERLKKHKKRLQAKVPGGGDVKIFFLTDTQWSRAITIVGKDYNRNHTQKDPKMPKQLEFW